MAYVHLGIYGVGSITCKKIAYNDGTPERATTENQTVDGPMIHTVGIVSDSEFSPTFTARISREQRAILLTIYKNSQPICDFDDGLNTYKGYIKDLKFISAFKNTYLYSVVFKITSRVI